MIWTKTLIPGCFIIDLDKKSDDRGFFARAFDEKEFKENDLPFHTVQSNISYCSKKGTIRGLHYQNAPHGELKFLRCIRGEVFDVVVDLRQDSPSFKKWVGMRLSQDNRLAVLVPEFCAHGYQSLTDGAEVFYSTSHSYSPDAESGVRYNDLTFMIDWPIKEQISLSDKDQNWPDYMEMK